MHHGYSHRLLDPDDAFIAARFTSLAIVHTELGILDEVFAYHQKTNTFRPRRKGGRAGNPYSSMAGL